MGIYPLALLPCCMDGHTPLVLAYWLQVVREHFTLIRGFVFDFSSASLANKFPYWKTSVF
jgi:hypothetical protein